MYPAPFNYHRPATLEEALRLLTQFEGEASVLSGGQSLIPMMKLRVGDFPEIVDIGRLPGLSHIEQRGDTVHIGALARHAQIANSDIAQQVPLLRDIAGGIADKQVRTMGTIGGGISIADPVGCWPCGLRTLRASVVCTGPNGKRTITVDDLIQGSYATCLETNEIVTEIQFAVPQGSYGGAYVAFKRAAPAYPTVAAGVMLELDGERCSRVRIVLGGAGTTTIVSDEAEAILVGTTVTDTQLRQAGEAIVAAAAPSPDARGTESFKRAMLRSLVVDAGQRALARARGEQVKGGHRYA
jgi:carbon-monoxide dehydrogenase medium subunit